MLPVPTFRRTIVAQGRFPSATTALIAAICAVFFAEPWNGINLVRPGLAQSWQYELPLTLSIDDVKVAGGQLYRLVTGLFLHVRLEHFLGNLAGLFVLGQIAERRVGSARFATAYLVTGISAGCAAVSLEPCGQFYGASTALFGTMGLIAGHLITEGRSAGDRRMLLVVAALALSSWLGGWLAAANVDSFGHVWAAGAGLLLGLWPSAGGRPRLSWFLRLGAISAVSVGLLAWRVLNFHC